MKQELSKLEERELRELARRLNAREDAIKQLKNQTQMRACQAVAEAMLQGQELLKAKAIVPYGLWIEWLAANCPTISKRSAQVYMRLALRSQTAQVSEAHSLREAVALLSDAVEDGSSVRPKKQWPEYLEGLYRFGKVFKFVADHPIDRWPEEGQEKLRTDLRPLAEKLWPDRFRA